MTRPNTTRRTIRVKLILVMNGIQIMIAQVKKKQRTIAIKKHSSSPKHFTNLNDDEERSTLFCLMGKGQKVKPKSKPTHSST
jgi:hypothetical protein